jgi:hypothetical protein
LSKSLFGGIVEVIDSEPDKIEPQKNVKMLLRYESNRFMLED